jgi:prepilin-type N-terminal cleavage/methylation domain-containing protein
LRRPARLRKGFTLAEVLVVLAITAVMAAVLMPVLIKQFRKGDMGRVVSDISSVQTGVEAFAADVRRIPSSLTDLTTAVTTSTTDIHGVLLPQTLVDRWNGPYLNKEAVAGVFPTGFGGAISSTIDIAGNGIDFAIITIDGLTETEVADLDVEIDGENNSSSGRWRWTGSDPDVVATFRLLPIN